MWKGLNVIKIVMWLVRGWQVRFFFVSGPPIVSLHIESSTKHPYSVKKLVYLRKL